MFLARYFIIFYLKLIEFKFILAVLRIKNFWYCQTLKKLKACPNKALGSASTLQLGICNVLKTFYFLFDTLIETYNNFITLNYTEKNWKTRIRFSTFEELTPASQSRYVRILMNDLFLLNLYELTGYFKLFFSVNIKGFGTKFSKSENYINTQKAFL